MRDLKSKVEKFMVELEQHAIWEDHALFPMVGLYIIAPVNQQQAKDIMALLMNGYKLLLEHFAAEERHVFPLADEIKEDIDYLSS